MSYDDFEMRRNEPKTDIGAARSVVEWRTANGMIRKEILKTGLHDALICYSVMTIAVMRSLDAIDPPFTE